MACAQDQTPIYSTFGNDPDFAELVEMFIDEIPVRMQALMDAFDSGDAEQVRRLAHQLKGAGGSYGFGEMTAPAAALEQAIKSGVELPEVASYVSAVTSICGRMKVGNSAS